MSEIGHNGGPRDDALTPSKKIERIKDLLDRADLTSAQKCVGVKLIAEADKEGNADVRTPELQRAASARDRETIFRATKALKAAGIERSSGAGQSGRFSVLPPQVVAAVVEAFEQHATGRLDPDRSEMRTGRLKPDGLHHGEPVGLIPTGPVEPVGLIPTGRLDPDRSKSRARATKESPSEIVISKVYSNTTHVEQEPARVGEEAVGHGVFVNCETVRHQHFTISIAGIAMQLATAPIDMTPEQRREAARASAVAHALQWAADIENGKRPDQVVPQHCANFIRGSIVAQFTKAARPSRYATPYEQKPAEGKTARLLRLGAELDAEKRAKELSR